jgi:hypothetical protein
MSAQCHKTTSVITAITSLLAHAHWVITQLTLEKLEEAGDDRMLSEHADTVIMFPH